MFFVIILLLWGGLNAYVITRLISIPFIVHVLPPIVLVPVLGFLAASYILARVMEHFELGNVSHWLEKIGANWVGLFFLLFVTFLTADVITGFGRLLPAYIPQVRTAALIAAVVMAFVSYVQAWRTPVVTNYEVSMRGLPKAADGTVVVAVTDTHLGAMIGYGWAQARASQIESLKPDVLLLVGDIFEGEKDTHEGWLPHIGRLHAPRGVFLVTGNHEFYAGPEPIITLFRKAGFRVLRDEHCEVLPGLVLVGVDDVSFRKGGRKDHALAMDKAFSYRPNGATIFLSHTPILAERAARMGAGLMLSGHTHEGQIWPFKYLVRIAFKLLSGRYDVEGMTAIVCRGTGTWGPRMRLWKRSEILRITLRSAL